MVSVLNSRGQLVIYTHTHTHTKRSKIGDLGPVHVGTWYASRHCDFYSKNPVCAFYSTVAEINQAPEFIGGIYAQ